jgi:hypothetical protein
LRLVEAIDELLVAELLEALQGVLSLAQAAS